MSSARLTPPHFAGIQRFNGFPARPPIYPILSAQVEPPSLTFTVPTGASALSCLFSQLAEAQAGLPPYNPNPNPNPNPSPKREAI